MGFRRGGSCKQRGNANGWKFHGRPPVWSTDLRQNSQFYKPTDARAGSTTLSWPALAIREPRLAWWPIQRSARKWPLGTDIRPRLAQNAVRHYYNLTKKS